MFPDDERPRWPVYVYFVLMVALIFAAPEVLDTDAPVTFGGAPYAWLAMELGVMALGLAAVLGAATEYRSWDREERARFWFEMWVFALLVVGGTLLGLLVCSLARWEYRVVPYFQIGPWLVFKVVQWLRRPRREVWE